MEKAELRNRTKQFALRVIKLVGHLPNTPEAKTPGCQVLCSALPSARSIVKHATPKAARILFQNSKYARVKPPNLSFGLIQQLRVEALVNEAEQLLSIMVASVKTLRATH